MKPRRIVVKFVGHRSSTEEVSCWIRLDEPEYEYVHGYLLYFQWCQLVDGEEPSAALFFSCKPEEELVLGSN